MGVAHVGLSPQLALWKVLGKSLLASWRIWRDNNWLIVTRQTVAAAVGGLTQRLTHTLRRPVTVRPLHMLTKGAQVLAELPRVMCGSHKDL